MALVFKDRVKETSTTTGTGAVTLLGTSGPYQAFSTIGNGNTTYYAIAGQTTSEWEVGIGTYNSAGNTLSRDTVLSSSNSNALVTFSAGTKDVFCTYPSEKAIYEEVNGETLFNGGPITIVGSGVTSYTSFGSALGQGFSNVNGFAQFYIQNQNNGVDASADNAVYNNLGDGTNYFIDMGISSSNYSSALYPIFPPNGAYVYSAGLTTGTGAAGETSPLLLGTSTANSDIILFAGGVQVTDEVMRIKAATKNVILDGSNPADTGEKLQVVGSAKITGATSFGSTVALSANPTTALQAATKQYVDSAVATGFTVHSPVRVATTAALPANTYNNGTLGVGATLTANANGALTIDGVAVATSDRVLIINEVAQANNGAYTVTATGSAGAPYVLTRATDFDTAAAGEIANNAYFFVTAGSVHAGSSFILSQTSVIVVGTTALPFTQFSDQLNYVGGTNIDITGLTISLTGTVNATNGGTGTNTVTTGDLLYGSGINTWGKLPVGAAYRSLVVNGTGTNVEWNAVALDQIGSVSGTLPATSGGTGVFTYALGDILYASSSTALTRLPGNTMAAKYFLAQTGTGIVSAAPEWNTLTAGDIASGSFGVTRGGTGITSYTVGDIIYASGTTTLSKLSDVAVGNALISGGIGAIPSWGKIGLTTHVSGTLGVTNGGTGASTLTGYVKGTGTAALTASATIPNTDISGLGTMSTQDANNVAITGGDITVSTLTATTGIFGGTF